MSRSDLQAGLRSRGTGFNSKSTLTNKKKMEMRIKVTTCKNIKEEKKEKNIKADKNIKEETKEKKEKKEETKEKKEKKEKKKEKKSKSISPLTTKIISSTSKCSNPQTVGTLEVAGARG